jgi:hypothetical protein
MLRDKFLLISNQHKKQLKYQPDNLNNGDNTESNEESHVAADGRNEIQPGSAVLGRVLQHCRTLEVDIQDGNVFLESVVFCSQVYQLRKAYLMLQKAKQYLTRLCFTDQGTLKK